MADRQQYSQNRGAQKRQPGRPPRGPQQPQEPKSKSTPTETTSSSTNAPSSQEQPRPSTASSMPSQSTVPPQTTQPANTLDDQISQIENGQEPDPLNDPVGVSTPPSSAPDYVVPSAGPVFETGPLDNELGSETPPVVRSPREAPTDLSATQSDDLPLNTEDQGFYYNGHGQRVIKEGAPVTIHGENVNGAIRVLDEIVQERRLPGSKRNGYWLLYAKGTLLPLSQVRQVSKAVMEVTPR